MLTAIGSSRAKITMPQGAQCKVGNLTIPANVAIDYSFGGAFLLSTGTTLTHVGPILADRRKIFFNALATQGTVSLAGSMTTVADPEWWSVNTTPGTTDMTAGIQAANAALVTIGAGEISLSPANYLITALTIGTSSAFTGISLGGTNGLSGTTLTYSGTGDAITVLKGRFVRLHDFLLVKSSATKSTSRGIVLTGTSGTGADTFYTEIERVTVGNTSAGFNIGVINGNGTNGFDADLTDIKHSTFQYNNIGLEITGQNSTQINCFDVSIAGNATYGVYNNQGGSEVNWYGGSFGTNGIGFYQLSSGNVLLDGIRDEFGGGSSGSDYQFYKNGNTPTINVVISRYIAAASIALNKPLIASTKGNITIRDSIFYSGSARYIPFGSYDNEGTGGGPGTTVRLINNIVNENVALIGIDTVTGSQDGLTYVEEGNVKYTDAGVLAGYFPNRRGVMIWPTLTDNASFTISTTAANSRYTLDFLSTAKFRTSAAPSSPAAGSLTVWDDSTDLRFHDKNAAGTIGTTVVADTGASNQFLTAISAAGVPSKAQPTEANLSTSDITTNNVTSTKHGLAPKSPADATQFLNGAATSVFALVKDSDLSTTDITTNDVTTSKHGFVPKATNVVSQALMSTATYGTVDTLLSTTAAVDMNTGTATLLFTCPTGKTCVITRVVVSNASTSLTTASWCYGWESATFTNVIATATRTELTGATLYTILIPKVGATLGTSTGTFKTLNTILQGGAATARMDVFGYVF